LFPWYFMGGTGGFCCLLRLVLGGLRQLTAALGAEVNMGVTLTW
jgi:hypothetical protein